MKRTYVPKPRKGRAGLSPAGRLLLAGHMLILLSLCDFAARMHTDPTEPLLYLETFTESVSLTVILLWAASLGLDLLDRSIHRE